MQGALIRVTMHHRPPSHVGYMYLFSVGKNAIYLSRTFAQNDEHNYNHHSFFIGFNWALVRPSRLVRPPPVSSLFLPQEGGREGAAEPEERGVQAALPPAGAGELARRRGRQRDAENAEAAAVAAQGLPSGERPAHTNSARRWEEGETGGRGVASGLGVLRAARGAVERETCP